MRMAGSLQTPEDAGVSQAGGSTSFWLRAECWKQNRSAFKSLFDQLCDLGKKPSFSVFICEMGKITVATFWGCSKALKDVDVKAAVPGSW